MAITKRHKEVIARIIKNTKPTKKEIEKLAKIQKEIIKKIKISGAKVDVGGSGAKETWLSNTHDIDIYVKFNYAKYRNKSKDLSEVLYKNLKKSFKKIQRIHGSRDYFQIIYEGYTVEIVPILEIKKSEQAENITDFSFHHVKYVKDAIKKKPSIKNDIRVAKVFAKANKFYGAESYIGGLSGYVLELLIIHYGSFLKFMNKISEWKKTTVIGNKKKAEVMNWAKKQSPLILIDPVQPERNAAAALYQNQYNKIIFLAKKFIRNPSDSLFEPRDIDLKKLQKKGKLTIVESRSITKKRDIAGAKAKKAFEFLIKHSNNFEVTDSIFDYDENFATFYIVTKKQNIPKEFKHYGPPITNKGALKDFKKVNKKYPIKIDKKEKKAYILKKTKHPDIQSHLKSLLTKEEVTSRIRDIFILE
jgi:tRNA nucleotidyltransferase (CCA-adding enzyme)